MDIVVESVRAFHFNAQSYSATEDLMESPSQALQTSSQSNNISIDKAISLQFPWLWNSAPPIM